MEAKSDFSRSFSFFSSSDSFASSMRFCSAFSFPFSCSSFFTDADASSNSADCSSYCVRRLELSMKKYTAVPPQISVVTKNRPNNVVFNCSLMFLSLLYDLDLIHLPSCRNHFHSRAINVENHIKL
jgi:hypothetical protein